MEREDGMILMYERKAKEETVTEGRRGEGLLI